MTYDTASETKRAARAKSRLERRFSTGEEHQAKLIKQVAETHIIDKLVPPAKINISCEDHTPKFSLDLYTEYQYRIHPHALSQMCSVVGFPKLYANRLRDGKEWEQELFEHNMNELFHQGSYLDRSKNPTKFLMRFVSDELRGFLSRSFNRHLASLPLLRGFVSACDNVGAKPIDATSSAVRFALKSFLPYVFEPVEGEFVAFGATWSNSDFGAGRMRVSLTVMRISSGTTSILEDALSRVHIGSVIQDSDLIMSDVTAAKEIDAQVSAIHDSISQQLSPDPVNKMCEAISSAHEELIPWNRIKSELGRLLHKKEVEDIKKMLESGAEDIVDLPPAGKTESGEPIATRWWASNVVGWMATREQSPDRKEDLQHLAGDLISKKGTK